MKKHVRNRQLGSHSNKQSAQRTTSRSPRIVVASRACCGTSWDSWYRRIPWLCSTHSNNNTCSRKRLRWWSPNPGWSESMQRCSMHLVASLLALHKCIALQVPNFSFQHSSKIVPSLRWSWNTCDQRMGHHSCRNSSHETDLDRHIFEDHRLGEVGSCDNHQKCPTELTGPDQICFFDQRRRTQLDLRLLLVGFVYCRGSYSWR